MENNIKCPKCYSENLSSDKKGFSGKNAVVGAIATGGIGILAGTIGSNQMIITCLNCGNKYKANDYIAEKNKYDQQNEFRKKYAEGKTSNLPSIIIVLALSLVGLFFSILLFNKGWNFLGVIFSIATLLVFGVFIFFVTSDINDEKKS
jgi:predicted nucleic-acid-binding Zn-ribbon protein